tara:strand:- start:283 stop:612 length:330 start_codon:yes stop_codon:yes gene_type:complete
MLKVKEVKAVVKVEVKENKIDRRLFNPGRPKSKESTDQEMFVNDLLTGTPFTVSGLLGEFEVISDVLYRDTKKVGSLLNVYPSKLKFETTTLIGNTVEFVIKFKDVDMK